MQPRFDGADGPGDYQCDLVVGQVLRMIEDKDQAVLGPKPIQSPFELSGKVIRVRWAAAWVDWLMSRINQRQHRHAAAAAQGSAATIGGDLQKPRNQRPCRIETRHRPQSGE